MKVIIHTNTYIYLGILLLLIPLPWLVAWLIAIMFHEFCHWVTVRLSGGQIYRLTVGLGGAVMECDTLSDGKALLSVLSGPLGGFLPLLLSRWLPRTAVCCWFLSVYNLFPLLPLDGGRALRLLIPKDRAFRLVERLVLCLLAACAVYAAFWLNLGIFPLVVLGFLWAKNRNSPCKERVCRVQ